MSDYTDKMPSPEDWLVDNRWSPGASGATAPTWAHAAYSARWIFRGMSHPADIVPDRQGFAYDTIPKRDELANLLARWAPHCSMTALDREDRTTMLSKPGFPVSVWMRRSGGYVYIDAWLTDNRRWAEAKPTHPVQPLPLPAGREGLGGSTPLSPPASCR